MKKLSRLLIFFYFVSCSTDYLDPSTSTTKDATFEITDITQTYYDSLGEYGLVEINYKVKNTGNVTIDYYQVWFQVTTVDGSTYTEWDNGTDVLIGGEISDSTYIDTADKEYSNITITDYELTVY